MYPFCAVALLWEVRVEAQLVSKRNETEATSVAHWIGELVGTTIQFQLLVCDHWWYASLLGTAKGKMNIACPFSTLA